MFLNAIEIADNFTVGLPLENQWEGLAKFRQALGENGSLAIESEAQRAVMTSFLQGLEVRIADRFSLSPFETPDGLDFEVVPFSGQVLENDSRPENEVSDDQAEFVGEKLQTFQKRLRTLGAKGSYRVADGSYLIIDGGAIPVLDLMARKQKAGKEEREEFIENPRPFITEKIADVLRESGALDDLTPAAEEEAIEAAAGPVFVETIEYSKRVTGMVVYSRPALNIPDGGGTTWLPEAFPEPFRSILEAGDSAKVESVISTIQNAVANEQSESVIEGERVPVSQELLEQLVQARDSAAAEKDSDTADEQAQPDDTSDVVSGPIILGTKDNLETVNWNARLKPRKAAIDTSLPSQIVTSLKEHQLDAFQWQLDAWQAGLPGVLNADEQGLGKTLQTIAFLRWLKSHMAQSEDGARGPVLVVAPTSLLENWNAEVEQHVDPDGLGHLIRLYGAELGGHKRRGVKGVDTDSGEAKLDLRLLEEAISEGKGHRFWILTTYTTLTNYQHSLGKIPFSAAVYDEVQAIKNPGSLRALAAGAVNADFQIGLTGTPIENSVSDIWAIMDVLCPGKLGGLKDFRADYAVATESNMADLHSNLFRPDGGIPPIAIRRLKETVARDLPEKSRRLHPRVMPQKQAEVYEFARGKLKAGGKGSALKMLHHIRTVSVHPSLAEFSEGTDAFVSASARLSAVMEILRSVQERNERALVFIEHRQMQYRFIELVRHEFGLDRVDLINGDTAIKQRQAIVNRFQNHLKSDGGFDLLVLGPKAAGTGLTLTAATHVIHLSRWWNPAVEEQCNDRVHRIGQSKPVTVHIPMAVHPQRMEGSFDCLLHNLMMRKRRLAASALWPMGDTKEDAGDLQRGIMEDMTDRQGNPVVTAMVAMFEKDKLEMPPFESDGSLICPKI